MAINSVVLSGRMVKDAELKLTKTKKFFTYFAVAVNREYKDDDGDYEVDFIDCMCFNQVAKYVSKYGYKGREVVVHGRLQMRTYETKSGDKRTIAEVKVDTIDLLGPSRQAYENRQKKSDKADKRNK